MADDSRRRYRADVAVVEDVCGGPLEGLFDTDPTRAAAALGEVAGMLNEMHRDHAPRYGRVDLLEQGLAASGASCEALVLERASKV
ncbi:hypothetical protein [Nonomuraea sp. MG754425]|uniref:hypothetical protein n=1 Tax=Nonomuraea sp. MG754425 TaxID=2570319 RepID=UPI001F1989EF|nr:hypothetical protein [Nonomuraea sp. MG754425]